MARRPDPLKRQQWRERFERFEQSGLTISAFCEAEGVSMNSFYRWRRKLEAEAGASEAKESDSEASDAAAAGFRPLLLTSIGSGARFRWPGDVVLEIGDDLRALERVLDRLFASQDGNSC